MVMFGMPKLMDTRQKKVHKDSDGGDGTAEEEHSHTLLKPDVRYVIASISS
jgi:hypothetical protein